MRLLLATSNPGKIRELRRLLADPGLQLVTPMNLGISLDVDEPGNTYAENAAIKARAFAEAGGCVAIADDSGIEVDALGSGPGVRSARYGGPGLDDAGRTALLLREMEGVPATRRNARYRAVVAIAWPSGKTELFDGAMDGRIGLAPRGEHGFGYDPIFELPDGRTSAELSDEEKDTISHRGIAVRKAAEHLRSLAR